MAAKKKRRIPKTKVPRCTHRGPLTPELAKSLVAAIGRKRVFDAQIAIAHGIHPDTLKNWVKRGLLPGAEEPYKSFAEAYAKAQIEDESDAVQSVMRGAEPYEGEPGSKPGDWKASAWYLERRYPLRWNPNRQPAAGPSEAIDVERLVREATEQGQSLVELMRDPPPELMAAMKEAREEILAALAVDVQPAQIA